MVLVWDWKGQDTSLGAGLGWGEENRSLGVKELASGVQTTEGSKESLSLSQILAPGRKHLTCFPLGGSSPGSASASLAGAGSEVAAPG
jgi:hypothetical protein